MANCPNCGAPLSKDGVCAACGFANASKHEDVSKLLKNSKFAEASIFVNEALNKDPNDGKACLDMVRILTKNFSEKPQDKEQCLDYAVRGLSYASDKDKADVEFKLLAYFENLHLGGRGVENVFDLKASVLGGAAVYGTSASIKPTLVAGAAAAGKTAPANSGKKAGKFASKLKKPMSKKKSIIVALVTLLVLGGIITGVVVGTTSGKRGGGGGEDTPSPQPFSKSTSVYFDKQGGSGGTSSVINYNGRVYDSIITPTKSGYTFDGYYTQPDGDGVKYYNYLGKACYSSWNYGDRSLTLYANWTPVNFTIVTFNKQGGSGGINNIENYYNQVYSSISVPEKSGYEFSGYYFSPDGYGTKYYDEDGKPTFSTWTYSGSSLTLYAYWVSEPTPTQTTSVTFNKQNGTGGTSSVTNTLDEPYNAITVPTRTGYEFDGYYTDTNGSGTKYYDSDGYPTLSEWTSTSYSLTLYANWVSEPVRQDIVIFDKQGGTGGTDSVINTYNQPYDSIEVPNKPGYTFVGYSSESNGFGNKLYNSDGTPTRETWDVIVFGSSATLYAYWTKAPSVTYEVNLNYGTYKWTYNSSTMKYTSYSGLADNNNSDMKITVSGSCTISFDYDVSSESSYDYFQIYKNGTSTRLNQYSGTTSGKFSTALSSSDYLILRYHKDSSNSSGRDNVIVSNIVVG